ncbi:MAG: right-handed parallel beta-helix repeat-containing protein [Planctomycetes bacterium]|nr:right-handed parallel beta-helix repeat-containing protein [Planctomycetota bacterium]
MVYGAGQGAQTNPYAGFSDHAPIDAARYAAVCFVEDNYQSNNCYHASCDNVDNPNYIHYDFAANFVRVIGGFLADNALAMHAGDCDNDGTPDADELAADPLLDCNGNGVLDSCEPILIRDCNGNAAPDVCDIAGGESLDRDRNGYPDECAATRLVPTDYATIQAAINAAVNGDTILVAPGVYSGAGNTGLDFGGKALTLRSSAGADQTIIQCTSTTSGIVLQTGEDRRCVIEGLTIMGGNVGISCTGASPNIRNCVISGHHAGNSGGGGIFLTRRSRPVIANCAVIGNSTTGPGGGVCCTLGASPLLLNSVIAGNSGANGGGLYCEQTSQAALRNCTLARNITAGRGGALYTLNSTALDNSSATLENCILWGNTAGAGQGEAIYVGQNTLVAAYYCDIQGGQAGVVGIGTILAWDHCLNVNPAFVNAGLNDYALLANSGCIDAGSNPRAGQDVGDVDFDGDAAEPPPVDLTGRPRFADRATTPDTGEGAAPLIDLGAQEYPPAACRADFDGDGAISISDLSILLSNFGCVPAPDACVGDTDGDGDVQLADLAELLSAFGQSCR